MVRIINQVFSVDEIRSAQTTRGRRKGGGVQARATPIFGWAVGVVVMLAAKLWTPLLQLAPVWGSQ